MQRRFQQVCSALKEHTFMSYAKIVSANGFSNMNLIIIKATTSDDLPLNEKYIQQLFKLLSTSPSSCHSFVISFTRRFGTTRSWRVALKCLILLHRLLSSVPRNHTLWTELLWARSNALISLYPCHFRDHSSFNPLSYTNFIVSYAHLLDEALNCVVLDSSKLRSQQQEEAVEKAMPKTFQEKMKEMGEILEMLPQLQSLIDRVIDCYPVGMAAQSFMVQCAMKLIVRDSFICYTKFRREMMAVLDNLLQMPYTNCIAAFNMYKKASVQTNKLYEFYEWCKTKGLCGLYEYPLVEPILYIQIKDLENVISEMWKLTESSTSPTSPSSSSVESPIKGGGERQVVIEGQEFEDEDERPLIDVEVEDNDDVSWETLLESSITFCNAYHNDLCNFFYKREWESGFDNEQRNFDGKGHEDETWKIAVYKSPATADNPFSDPN
ncbi:hypothetical protein VNO77_00126 [Canavalia gladiata]|uniref:ENTH domain-containing protein n=1 Tax=Canavalia gladiata TaxID=3824 RepID=A0AAN9MPH9_CANGL